MNKLKALEDFLQSLGPISVAVSGGVDSMTLAVIAHRLNPHSHMYHAVSPAVPAAATDRVKRYGLKEAWQLHLIDAKEFEDGDYRSNPVNRCYFCKNKLYQSLNFESDLPIASGANVDDLQDYRPGLIAASEHEVVHPYVEVGIDKQTIRNIAEHVGLHDISQLPASPCLASRVTTGIPIHKKLLPLIDKVESAIWDRYQSVLSLSVVRCRILSDEISIQLQGNLDFSGESNISREIQGLVRSLLANTDVHAFSRVTIKPYQQGSAFVHNAINVVNINE